MFDQSNRWPIEILFQNLDTTDLMGVKADEWLRLRKCGPHHTSKMGTPPLYDAMPLHCSSALTFFQSKMVIRLNNSSSDHLINILLFNYEGRYCFNSLVKNSFITYNSRLIPHCFL